MLNVALFRELIEFKSIIHDDITPLSVKIIHDLRVNNDASFISSVLWFRIMKQLDSLESDQEFAMTTVLLLRMLFDKLRAEDKLFKVFLYSIDSSGIFEKLRTLESKFCTAREEIKHQIHYLLTFSVKDYRRSTTADFDDIEILPQQPWVHKFFFKHSQRNSQGDFFASEDFADFAIKALKEMPESLLCSLGSFAQKTFSEVLEEKDTVCVERLFTGIVRTLSGAPIYEEIPDKAKYEDIISTQRALQLQKRCENDTKVQKYQKQEILSEYEQLLGPYLSIHPSKFDVCKVLRNLPKRTLSEKIEAPTNNYRQTFASVNEWRLGRM